jgi:hypothetical protein
VTPNQMFRVVVRNQVQIMHGLCAVLDQGAPRDGTGKPLPGEQDDIRARVEALHEIFPWLREGR